MRGSFCSWNTWGGSRRLLVIYFFISANLTSWFLTPLPWFTSKLAINHFLVFKMPVSPSRSVYQAGIASTSSLSNSSSSFLSDCSIGSGQGQVKLVIPCCSMYWLTRTGQDLVKLNFRLKTRSVYFCDWKFGCARTISSYCVCLRAVNSGEILL